MDLFIKKISKTKNNLVNRTGNRRIELGNRIGNYRNSDFPHFGC